MELFMKKKTMHIIIIANILIIGLSFGLFFSGTDFSEEQKEQRNKIGACYMTMNNTYFQLLNNEISAAVEEKGDILITRDPAMNQERQNEQIEELIEEGVKAIFLTPVDWKAIKPALEKAKKHHVIIIVVDSQVYDEELVDCTVVSDNYDAGVQIANYLMSKTTSAKIVLLEQENAKSCIDRIQGFTDTIAANKEYAIVDRSSTDGQVEKARTAMKQIIDSNSAFDTVFAVNSGSAMGTMVALQESGLDEGINVCSIDGSPEEKKMIQKNKMMATMAQFPETIGSKAAEVMYDLLAGKDREKEMLIPEKLIAKFNIAGYDVDKWQ